MKNYLVKNNNNNDLFSEMFGDFFKPVFYGDSAVYMATDVKEKEKSYELEIEMPGYNKEDITVDFEKGYLTVSAKKDEKQEEGKKYISRERHSVCRRSYYVGEIDENGITAKYENGVLSVDLPKRVEEKPQTRRISVD